MRLRGWLWHIMQPLFKGRTCLQNGRTIMCRDFPSRCQSYLGSLHVFQCFLESYRSCPGACRIHVDTLNVKWCPTCIGEVFLLGFPVRRYWLVVDRCGVEEHETEKETSDPLPTCPDNLVADPVGRQQGRNCNLGTRCVRAGPVERRQGHNYKLFSRH